jgi:hypothetical protein
LAISKRPRLTPTDLSLSFGAIAFPVHVWTIINILVIFPAWLLRLSLWELAGAISYPLVEALLESGLIWLVLVGASFVLPRKWLADKFVVLASALVWLLAAWAILAQFNLVRLLQWGPLQWVPGLIVVVLSFGLVIWLIHRFARVESTIKTIVQRLAVLTYIYIIFDVLGLLVIILRNL